MREFWPVIPLLALMIFFAGRAIIKAERESIRTIRQEPTEHGPLQ